MIKDINDNTNDKEIFLINFKILTFWNYNNNIFYKWCKVACNVINDNIVG